MQGKSTNHGNVGRPTKYTKEKAIEICELIATTSLSMIKICQKVDVPYGTHLEWVRSNPEYSRLYAIAKEDQADYLAEEMLEIADDSSNDVEEYDLGNGMVGTRTNSEVIQRSRLRVDTRKFIASKLKPKKYGDRMEQVITTGKDLPPWITKEPK